MWQDSRQHSSAGGLHRYYGFEGSYTPAIPYELIQTTSKLRLVITAAFTTGPSYSTAAVTFMIPVRAVHTAVLSQGRYRIQGWNAWALIESAYEFHQLLLTHWGRVSSL